jgi:prepilin-type processing-associated H-X9-DG protein
LLVVIAIIAILSAILFPVFVRARERADTTVCLSRMKQLGLAFMMYGQDHDQVLPQTYQWKSRLQSYIKQFEINRCPSRPYLYEPTDYWFYGQGYNIGSLDGSIVGCNEQPLGRIKSPSRKILVAEWDRCNAGPPLNAAGDLAPSGLVMGGSTSYWAVCRTHHGGSNVLFCDGHAKWMRPEEYHSTMPGVSWPDGVPETDPTEVEIAPQWREYWDTSYKVN